MKYNFTGKNLSIYDDVKDQIEKKLSRLGRLVSEDAEVFVALSKVRHQYKLEVSVPMHKRMLRAESINTDVATCLDSVADVLEKQVVKYKGRLRDRSRRNVATVEEVSYLEHQADAADSSEVVIKRSKKFALKPMTAQDAVMEMELLDHSFFVFRNAETDEVNVVYKRKEEEYGLIEPN